MGLINSGDDEEQSESNDGNDSGTYIQFISGPNHRDWKDSWSEDAADTISKAHQFAAPEASGNSISDYVTPEWEDRNHFYADVTVALESAFEEQDFSDILDLLMGVGEDEPEAVAEVYAESIVSYLQDNPEVAEKVMEQANASPAPADD